MKHYTYSERYEKLRKDVAKYMKEHGGKPFFVMKGGPKVEVRVSMQKRNGSKKIYVDFVAYRQKVGMGLERIKNLFEYLEYENIISEIEKYVVNHDMSEPIVIVSGDVVKFRYEISPRQEFVEQW